MNIKNRVAKHVLVAIAGGVMALFFTMVDRAYNNILENEQKIQSIPQAKPINPNIDSTFLDFLERQNNISRQEVTYTELPLRVSTPTPGLGP